MLLAPAFRSVKTRSTFLARLQTSNWPEIPFATWSSEVPQAKSTQNCGQCQNACRSAFDTSWCFCIPYPSRPLCMIPIAVHVACMCCCMMQPKTQHHRGCSCSGLWNSQWLHANAFIETKNHAAGRSASGWKEARMLLQIFGDREVEQIVLCFRFSSTHTTSLMKNA